MSAAPDGPREHWGGVLGVAFGLALLAGLVAVIAMQPARAEDAGALLAEWFEPAPELGGLPLGLRVDGAATLPDGRRTVRLVDPAAPAEVDQPTEGADTADDAGDAGEAASGGSASATDAPPRPAAGPEGSVPREVMIVEYPRSRAAPELRRLFFSSSTGFGPGGGASMQGEHEGGEEGKPRRVVMERDELAWGRFVARFVHERELGKDGGFRDTLRVNLSHDETALVLFARWTRGLPASRERIAELLDALRAR